MFVECAFKSVRLSDPFSTSPWLPGDVGAQRGSSFPSVLVARSQQGYRSWTESAQHALLLFCQLLLTVYTCLSLSARTRPQHAAWPAAGSLSVSLGHKSASVQNCFLRAPFQCAPRWCAAVVRLSSKLCEVASAGAQGMWRLDAQSPSLPVVAPRRAR